VPSLPVWLLVALYAAIWVAIHIGSGFIAHRMPISWFDPDGVLFRTRAFERGGRVYRAFGIRRWKDALPEAGAFFEGGFSKRSLVVQDPAYLERYLAETCRAEASHWMSAALSLTFFLWNPWYVGVIMVVYGLSTNLPFILVQRYNRPRLARAALRSYRASSDGGRSSSSSSS
jgi:glycosyl-4,4'-diaponeurosporenoate acyltransferase